MTLPITFVVAMAENRVIGKDNALIWRQKSDLKHFKALTLGRPVIMGSKTFKSIGKPLKDRENIVLTRNTAFAAEGVHVAHAIADALALADRLGRAMGASDIAVAGGADIYQQLIDKVDKIELTLIHAQPEGDAYFPEFEHLGFVETRREAGLKGPEDQYSFTFLTYERG